jgi:micrococcal nuclease
VPGRHRPGSGAHQLTRAARPAAASANLDVVVGRTAAAALVVMVAAACSGGTLARDERATGTSRAQPTPAASESTTTSSTSSTSSTSLAPTPGGVGLTGAVTVVDVVDGDTIKVSTGETLRLIGVDTPETRDPRRPVQCFGREASARAHALLDGARVRLEHDPSQGRRDKYGRTLAYVWLPDGRLYNETIIAEGYAHEYTYAIPYRYRDAFRAAERSAREAGRGLWSPATCAGDTEQPAARVTPPPDAPAGCDASYAGVCIPSPPPDLDCGDIAFRRFAVVGPDPHRFDGEGDGIGCE